MSVTFQKDATTVTLPNPEGGQKWKEIKHQATELTAAGTRYTYDKGISRQEVELSFNSLTNTQKSDLVSFFDTTVNGSMETFTYTDSESNAHTSRFLEPELEPKKVANGVWDVPVKLEITS